MNKLTTKQENGTYQLNLDDTKVPKGHYLIVVTDGTHDFGFIMPKNEKDFKFYFDEVNVAFQNKRGQTSSNPTK